MVVNKKWECSECSKTFNNIYNFKRHLVIHDKNGQVKCEICGKILKNLTSLPTHKRNFHETQKRLPCNICGRGFSSPGCLRRHAKSVHATTKRKRISCTFSGCDKTFSTAGNLRQHFYTEHAENPIRYLCTLCGREFKSRGNLGQHVRAHTTEKPHKCPTCGRGFAQMTYLRFHQATHEENLYIVPIKTISGIKSTHDEATLPREGEEYLSLAVGKNEKNPLQALGLEPSTSIQPTQVDGKQDGISATPPRHPSSTNMQAGGAASSPKVRGAAARHRFGHEN
ncbi:PR domain zinc finger protein 5 [Folsomia candida]|uniref:PR domain zinc finger protein 5 n=1 Tax=Folsomia candida TaxID=158441 RepID=A0A226DCG9_FOLCA|nr:PR domain zinc finger protein 5 [Folsomia candida]